MSWQITLGSEGPAISWPYGETVIQAAVTFVETHFPRERPILAHYRGSSAEVRLGDVLIRIQRRAA